ncbi:MAG: Ohr family peroxiredoxin [Propionibacteriales bacterium]|nr:Ohr family peroxiredoxin [Propionibacteriales bacterium]
MNAIYTASATASGREGRAVSSDGILDVTLATPAQLGGTGTGTNPEQLFAAGYAACFASAMGVVARSMRIDASEASVTADIGLKGSLDAGFALEAVLRVELPSHLEGEAGHQLVAKAHQVCPYSNATRGNIPVEIIID